MFLQYILKRDETELIHKFFKAQEAKPHKMDWCSTIKDDLNKFDLNLSFEDIQNMSKDKFKEMVKTACKKVAFEFLLKLKDGHSKGEDIVYGNFKLQNYLNSELFNTKQAKLLFKLRSRMVDVRNNYKNKYKDNLLCPVQCAVQLQVKSTPKNTYFFVSNFRMGKLQGKFQVIHLYFLSILRKWRKW